MTETTTDDPLPTKPGKRHKTERALKPAPFLTRSPYAHMAELWPLLINKIDPAGKSKSVTTGVTHSPLPARMEGG